MYRTTFKVSIATRYAYGLAKLPKCVYAAQLSRISLYFPQTATISSRFFSSGSVISSDLPLGTIGSKESSTVSDQSFNLNKEVLEAALKEVPEHGWTREAVEKACLNNNYAPGMHSIIMPNGPVDLIVYFYSSRNEMLAEELRKLNEEKTVMYSSTVEMKIPKGVPQSWPPLPRAFNSDAELDAYLLRALRLRLSLNLPLIQRMPQAMAVLAMPQNAPTALGLLAELVDEVWANAGDTSTDMRWYAKRMGLAYVYNLTEVFMLQDNSAEYCESWKFLERRISDLRSMKQANLKSVASMVKEGVFAFGNVTSSLLGIRRR